MGWSGLPTRIEKYIQPEPNSGCWLWLGYLRPRGYARLQHDGHRTSAARMVYEILRGQALSELEPDHLCRLTCCVNPDHQEFVTHKENVLRSTAPSAQHARQTMCVRGHPFDAENIYVMPDGRRQCRTCVAFRKKRWREGRQK